MLGCMACQVDDHQEPLPVRPTSYEAMIRASQGGSTRTSLGEGSGAAGSEQEIRWEVGDRLAVWAKSEQASAYLFEATTFELATYNATYSSADFLATVPAMERGSYRYEAVYPEPETRTGTQVSYTLPATQSGVYDPSLDVMWAATSGDALQPNTGSESLVQWQSPELNFSHLMHLVRIRIPEGKNLLGLGIQRLDITFPQEVVGKVTFDVTDPEHTMLWSDLSNKVTVELAEEKLLDAGEGYLWLHVKPTELNGEIRFVAYNEAGVESAEISTTVQKTLEPQRITPIALTIPESPLGPITYLDIREVANNLGEPWQTMTLTGYNFVVPYTSTTTNTLVLTPNDKNRYIVAICADPSTMGGKSLPLSYESVHCLFDDPITLASSLAENSLNRVDKRVPYLLEEDFSGISSSFENGTVHKTSDAGEYDAIALAQYGLNDWYGARIGGGAGQNIRICSRMEMGLWVTNRNTGRVDTPVLTKLKPNANASIRVDYDYAGDRYEAVGSGGFPVYSAGTTTSVVTAGDDTIPSVVVADVVLAIDGSNADGTFYGNTPHHNTFTAAGCGNTTRVSWYLTNNREAGFAGNGMYWMYIDNVKVQIAQ